MGCICSKGAYRIKRCRVKEKEPKKTSSKRLMASSKKEDVVVEVDNGANEATTRLISTENAEKSTGSTPPSRDEGGKSSMVLEKPMEPQISRSITAADGIVGGQPKMSRVFSVRNGVDGAQVVAGWPPWLTAVAGEAIKGWVPRRADSFEKLDKIGQGTYSSVYRARDLETGKIVALKKVRFVNVDPESVRFMSREILILRRLDHPNVMKLEGLVTSRVSCNLYLVFEYMEHDLAGLAGSQKVKFTEAQIKCFMLQLLRGLEHCHNRGVLHRDIKGSNLLVDNNGILKIGDFGLATFCRTNQKQPLTSRVVTLWYRPPELLLGATDYGPTVDLWSAGCILAELFAGKPVMPGRTEVEQLHKIFKLCGSPSEAYWKRSKLPHATIFKPQQPYKRTVAETFKNFPPTALALLDVLLAFEPVSRGSTTSALQHEFFTKKPLPCDPSMLPKYPPSKEFDVKVRDEEARRQKVASSKGRGSDSHGRSFNESRAVPAPDANAELPASIQKYKGLSNSKSNSEQYNPEEDGGSGFPIDPADRPSFKGVLAKNGAFRGSTNMHANGAGRHVISQVHSSGHSGVELGTQRSRKPQGGTGVAQLSRFSNSVAVRGSSHLDQSRGDSTHSQWRMEQLSSKYNASDRLLGLPSSLCKKDEAAAGKEHNVGCSPKNTKMHYSGPLFPAAGNLDEMLREHERHIQEAVRRARLDKNKNTKGYHDNAQTESLLQYVGNGR